MQTKKTILVVEIVAFSYLLLTHWALWFLGLALGFLFLLGGFIPDLAGSPLLISLSLVPAICISIGWCVYRIRHRTIRKTSVYFIVYFFRHWLLWLLVFFAILMGVAQAFLSVNTWSPSTAGLAVLSCVIAALCVSVGWSIYNVRKHYLGIAEFPTKEFKEFLQAWLKFLRKFCTFFVLKDTKRS
ncbi:MAG: hypothetical protein F4Z01_08735 [Gammaproteobacteria bacterium]|nr:hypothetical protein [Gammaproteobacteria bacterium]MYF38161.1 hypothetical protein [Gammaproteobacteria bacterium]